MESRRWGAHWQMTQIDFYTHVTDRLETACRLVAKAVSQGLRVMIATPSPEVTLQLDRLLWSVPSTGFLPHCRPDDPLAAETPVILDHENIEPTHDDLLVNLRPERPPYFSRFQRLVEIVSLDEADKTLARERFRFYRDRGYPIRSHDLGKGST